MAVSKQALGINARNVLFVRALNPPRAHRRANNKLATKRLYTREGIATPRLIAAFKSRRELFSFRWDTLPKRFVLKPARGYGGKGIIAVKKWNGKEGECMDGTPITLKEIERHLFDVFEGVYSLGDMPDSAFVEEFVTLAPFFKKMQPAGLPDIRVIVANGIPVMAMLRFPTAQSGGRANVHQGAIGVGIDMGTGITLGGLRYQKPVDYFPGTKVKTRGVCIPRWDEILRLASRAQRVSELGFAGVDIVMGKTGEPLVLEINAAPGLEIQNVNRSSLRTRLDRIHYLKTPTVKRAVEIAKSLFAHRELENITPRTGHQRVIGIIEPVLLSCAGGEKEVFAKMDTGAYRTSIDESLCKELGCTLVPGKRHKVWSATGVSSRPLAQVQFILNGKRIVDEVTVMDRAHMRYPMIVGRRNLRGFLVDPSLVLRALHAARGKEVAKVRKEMEEEAGTSQGEALALPPAPAPLSAAERLSEA